MRIAEAVALLRLLKLAESSQEGVAQLLALYRWRYLLDVRTDPIQSIKLPDPKPGAPALVARLALQKPANHPGLCTNNPGENDRQ